MPRPKPDRSKTVDNPEWLAERARKGGSANSSLDMAIRRVVEGLPKMTDEQRARLAELVTP